MGKADADKLNFWAKAEYDSFIRGIDKESRYFVILKYSFGLAVERRNACPHKSDIDFENNQISITKTYYRTERRDIITTPKTEQSIRVIDIPEFLKKR